MQLLAKATHPAETKKVESTAAAARAWAKENQDYEAYVQAVHAYIMARRKTTELIQPFIQHGGHQGRTDVTLLADAGFTKQQWHRRIKELEMPMDALQDYFDECIENGWHPSVAGALKHVLRSGAPEPVDRSVTCPNCGTVIHR